MRWAGYSKYLSFSTTRGFRTRSVSRWRPSTWMDRRCPGTNGWLATVSFPHGRRCCRPWSHDLRLRITTIPKEPCSSSSKQARWMSISPISSASRTGPLVFHLLVYSIASSPAWHRSFAGKCRLYALSPFLRRPSSRGYRKTNFWITAPVFVHPRTTLALIPCPKPLHLLPRFQLNASRWKKWPPAASRGSATSVTRSGHTAIDANRASIFSSPMRNPNPP